MANSLEQVNVGGSDYNLSVPFIIGTGSTAGTWLGSLDGLTEYYDGLLILYKPSVAGASTTTLNINSLGAKTCYLNNTTKLTTHYPAHQPILLSYSTSQNSGCWMAVDNYIDGNTNNAVTQTTTSTSANYEVLFSATADNTTRTEGARKNNNLLFNPSTGNLQTTQLNGVAIGTSPKFTDTDTKVTAVSNHYTPTEDASAILSADASGGSAATWNSTQLVTGVDIKRDAKGHVTGVAVDSIKLPSNPNTDTHRPIQMDGTQILGNNTTALNIKAGNGITLTNPTSGAITITALPNSFTNFTLSATSCANNSFVKVGNKIDISELENGKYLLLGYVSFNSAAAGKIMEVAFNCDSAVSNYMTKPTTRGALMDAGGGAWAFAYFYNSIELSSGNQFWLETRQQSGSAKTTSTALIWAIKLS